MTETIQKTQTLEPHPLTDVELALLLDGTAGAVDEAPPAPVEQPPSAGQASSASATLSGQKITALWAEQTNRNAWANFQTAGWKKLSPLTDCGSTTMALLAAHARATGSAPVADENPAGTVAVMYVW